MGTVIWNRCDICGRFIALDEFADGKAIHHLREPDSELGVEKWDTFHLRCDEKLLRP